MPTSRKTANRVSVEGRWRNLPAGLLLGALVSYPLAAHYGAGSGQWMPAICVLVALLLLLATGARGWHRIVLVMGVVVVVGAVVVVDDGQAGALLAYSQPVLVNVALCYLFGHTLLGGRRPLINRYILAIRGDVDAPTALYGRRLTQFWTVLFAALALESALVAYLASGETWSLVTGVFNYLLIVVVIAVEYRIRVRVLSHLTHPGFAAFLRALTRCPLSTLLRD